MDFPLTQFHLMFPQFSELSDDVVLAASVWALCYAQANTCECGEQTWQLLTAHILALRAASEAGNTTSGAIQSASIDKISVSFAAAPVGDGWTHWLNLSPFGMQFLALSRACSSGGLYVGGLPERAGFRSVGGSRGGRWGCC